MLSAIAGMSMATLAYSTTASEGWTTTGVGFGPAGITAEAAETAPIDETIVVEDESTLDEFGDGTVLEDDVTIMETEPVAGPGSACGLQVVATSPGAVGDPCMTSEAFAATLAH